MIICTTSEKNLSKLREWDKYLFNIQCPISVYFSMKSESNKEYILTFNLEQSTFNFGCKRIENTISLIGSTCKGGLISESFSLWFLLQQNVPNHYPKHYPLSKKKMLRRDYDLAHGLGDGKTFWYLATFSTYSRMSAAPLISNKVWSKDETFWLVVWK